MMNQPAPCEELIQDLNRSGEWELAAHLSEAELETVLAEKLNLLIRSDFQALVRLLYRIDINESRLREVLKTNAGEDAGRIMARMILERQWQKIQTRRQFKAGDTASDEEKW